MFIIDFDDTLFDTQAFKRARLEAVKKCGVSEKEYSRTYKMARQNQDGAFGYSSERQAEILDEAGYNEKEVLAAFRRVESEIKNFIFPEASNFLEKIKTFAEPVILLSLGDSNFQRQKVKEGGLEKYFDRVIVVNKKKEGIINELLNELGKSEDVWMVNDKPAEASELKNKFPGVNFVMIQSIFFSEAEYEELKIPYFKNLMDIYDFIRQNR